MLFRCRELQGMVTRASCRSVYDWQIESSDHGGADQGIKLTSELLKIEDLVATSSTGGRATLVLNCTDEYRNTCFCHTSCTLACVVACPGGVHVPTYYNSFGGSFVPSPPPSFPSLPLPHTAWKRREAGRGPGNEATSGVENYPSATVLRPLKSDF